MFRPLARSPRSGQAGAAELGGSLRQYRIGLVIGTRPEAIKLAPVAHRLAHAGALPHLYLTGQHPGLELADHGLQDFRVTPLGYAGLPDPIEHGDRVAAMLERMWRQQQPDLVMVQGDTSSAYGGARAAATCAVPLAHVEAGLRTHDPDSPWPEENFRVAIDALSNLLFAPTATSAANLHAEQCVGAIHVTGNSGIDALLAAVPKSRAGPPRRAGKMLKLLVTCHRRETWGAGFAAIADALVRLVAEDVARVEVVLHPNPKVSAAMFALLHGRRGIGLMPPLSHSAMIAAMGRADLLLSDSGGIQEEAPALGVPLLVLRDKTERPEGVDAGAMKLVGADTARIVAAVTALAADQTALAAMSRRRFPFGDGRAAPRIAALALAWLADREGGVRVPQSA